jgi:outer membrane protein OmpA-like peptidoglycan-associated protein
MPEQRPARAVAPPPPSTADTAMAAKREAPKPDSETSAPASQPAPRMAALPPAGEAIMQLRFRSGSSAISTDDEVRLAELSKQLADSTARLQLKAFADAANGNSSSTRRLSLSRALAVRAYLIENGMRSTRIDVRALGTAKDGGPSDRVDVILLDR